MKIWRELRWSVVVFLVMYSLSCSLDPVSGKKTYNWYSLSDDVRFGKQVLDTQLADLHKQSKTYDTDTAELARIKEIVRRIARVSHHPDFPYEAHLANLPIVNAWCAPGGKIMVYTGLWDGPNALVNKRDANELAAVLGHEMAHANARHVTKALSRNMTLMVVGEVATSIIGAASVEGADLFGQIFSQGVNVYVPSYSRKNESQADRIGLMYMARAGYDPRAAVRLWERAAQKRGDRTSIYSSHPANGERAKKLRELLPAAMEAYEATRGHKSKK